MIILACLTTAVGLIVANSEYFHTLFPSISYKVLVVFFSLLTFTVANFALTNIISYSIPILMFLYPLAIVLMILTFVSPLFRHAQLVYAATIGVTFLISIVDGLVALVDSLGIEMFGWLTPIVNFYESRLPMFGKGLGCFLQAILVIVVTGIFPI